MHQGIIPVSPGLMAILSQDELLANSLLSFTREIFLLDIVVAGVSYCPEKESLPEKLDQCNTLRLQRDPKNEHDPMAIACYLGELRIGWVPQELNQIISRLMDAGKAFVARVEKYRKINDWLKIDCKIYMVE